MNQMVADGVDTAAVQVRAATVEDAARWDAFVSAAPDATFFHRAAWPGLIASALGHRDCSLLCERNGEVAGVLPLVEVRSPLFGHALMSLPFLVYGGPLGDAGAVAALCEAAAALAGQRGAAHLELRNLSPRCPDWPRKDVHVTFRRELAADDDANLKAIPRKQRAMVRKGIKAGLQARHRRGAAALEDLDLFYRVFSESYRNLGTPVLGKTWFRRIIETFGDAVEITVVTRSADDPTPIAACLSYRDGDRVLPYYGGGTAAARGVAGNDFLYWAIMQHVAAEGVREFDFGRSKVDSGSYRFKKHWGFEPEALAYECWVRDGGDLPDVNPNNPRYRLLVNTWQRLPVSVSRMIGPFVARQIG